MPNSPQDIDTKSRIESLGAFIDALEDDVDKALSRLEGKVDPDSIRRKLAILIDSDRIDEAVSSIPEGLPHPRWCENAVVALTRAGQFDSAETMLDWARSGEDQNLESRCAFKYANELLRKISLASPTSDFNADLLARSESALHDTIRRIKTQGRPSNQLESLCVQVAIQVALKCARIQDVEELSALLMAGEQVPLFLAELSVNGQIKMPLGLVDRLRNDYPTDFEAMLIAAIIESRILGKSEAAFANLQQLDGLATENDEKIRLGRALVEVSQSAGVDPGELETILQSLDSTGELERDFKVDTLLVKGEFEEAKSLLDGMPEPRDQSWMVRYAYCLERLGDPAEAIKHLESVEGIDDLFVTERIAEVAISHGMFERAGVALEALVERFPDDHRNRRNLASVYTQLNDWKNAVTQLRLLREAEPDNEGIALQLAQALVASGQPEESLPILNEVCAAPRPSLDAILARASIQLSTGRAADAFSSLNDWRDEYWDNVNFVGSYMSAAYASGSDDLAHDAMQRLQELERDQRPQSRILTAVPFDELRKQVVDFRDTRESGLRELLKGTIPWLMYAELTRTVPYWEWAVRTQELNWLEDDDLFRSQYTVYSTNSYAVTVGQNETRELTRLSAPEQGQTIVCDLTALITLHRLKILHQAAKYFQKIVIPREYLGQVLPDMARLVPHQLSQLTTAQQVRESLDLGLIESVPDRRSALSAGSLLVDEYDSSPTDPRHSLHSVVNSLYTAGLISDDERSSLNFVIPVPEQDEDALLDEGQCLLFDIMSLETLVRAQLLERVTSYFRTQLTDSQCREVRSRLRTFDLQTSVHDWHADLWKELREEPAIDFARSAASGEQEDDTVLERIPLSAVSLAQKLGRPLFADDRSLQMLMQNREGAESTSSFGSDAVIIALMDAQLISEQQALEAYQKLFAWRYRFVIPAPKILKGFADRYLEHLPGEELRCVSSYVHDCFSDPGLFTGVEQTTQPISLAIRLHQTWIQNIAEFLIMIWADTRYSIESAESLTRWAIACLLPGVPRTLAQSQQQRLADLTPRSVITFMQVQTIAESDSDRMRHGLEVAADAFGLSYEEFLDLMTRVVIDD